MILNTSRDDNFLKMSFCTEILPRSNLYAHNLPRGSLLTYKFLPHQPPPNKIPTKKTPMPRMRAQSIIYSTPSQISVCSLFIFRPITTITAVNMIPIMIAGTVLSTPNPTL